jgi:hypothetical protein
MGHWYKQDGEPCYTVMGKNGKERDTTLRDARTMDLVPSVTTILGVADKPALTRWFVGQAIEACIEDPYDLDYDTRSVNDYVKKLRKDAQEVGKKAAEKGTQIHDQIESGFKGFPNVPYEAVRACLSDLFPEVDDWVAEESFCSQGGYGGKIDLYSPSAYIVVDFKTKEGIEGKEGKKLAYDEQGMQLAAYASGAEDWSDRGYDKRKEKEWGRVNLFIDRNDTNIVIPHIWDEDAFERHWKMFNHLLKYWQQKNRFQI